MEVFYPDNAVARLFSIPDTEGIVTAQELALTFHPISPDPLIQGRDASCTLRHKSHLRLGFGGRAQENDPDFTCPSNDGFGANLWLAR